MFLSKGLIDLVKFIIFGKNGKLKGGDVFIFGILGRLGGIGVRLEVIGFVLDGDGVLVVIVVVVKFLDM